MKRLATFMALFFGGFLLIAADGCSSDPNVEGAKLDLRNKDYDRAIENVNTALERDPQNAEALDLKGRILQEQAFAVQDPAQHMELVEEMIDAYNRAVEVDPSLGSDVTQRLRLAYYNEFQRGIQAFNRGKEDEAAYGTAADYFATAALIQPDSAGAYVNQAFALINAGQQQEAVAPFETAIEKGENAPETYVFLGELYIAGNEPGKAVTLFEQANQVYPDNADIQANLLNAYMQADQLDRAMNVYQQAVQRDPSNKLYRYNYGSLLLDAEQYDEAIEQLQQAVALDPEYANAQYNLGAAYINKAVDMSEEINALDDELRETRDNLSDAQIREKEQQIQAMSDDRRDLFAQAIPPLEKAREQMAAAGENATGVCQALFQAYVQTNQQDKAQAVAECAGYEDME